MFSKEAKEQPDVQQYVVDTTGGMLSKLTMLASASMEGEELKDV